MEVSSTKRAREDLGGVIIRVPSIASIEPATDGKTTIIITNGCIGTMDNVESSMSIGKNGIVVNIGDNLVIENKPKKKK